MATARAAKDPRNVLGAWARISVTLVSGVSSFT
jgi:hypothetical protein